MPSITTWNRLEPRSRSVDMSTGLQARVQDPLWFLTRQWQVGEFQGRDTGSPVTGTVKVTTSPIDRFSVAQAAQAYDSNPPLEVSVEQEKVRPTVAAKDYRQAAEAGLYFLRLLNAASLPPTIAASYLQLYPLSVTAGDALTISSIVAGRVIDGIKLHSDLIAAGSNLPALPAIPAGPQHDSVLQATRTWLSWYSGMFSEPGQSDSWSEDRMEYGFSVAVAEASGSYSAQEYDGGSVDWYTFNSSPTALAAGTAKHSEATVSVLTTPVTFRGMPARRFWEMEDGGTNFAQISAAAEDIGRILFRDFALIYGNDWFQFPLTVAVGSQIEITALTVTDTFGIPTLIPHYSAAGGNWRMFNVSSNVPATAAAGIVTPHSILIAPNAVAPVEGPIIEEVLILRDELSNVVWGIERKIPGASGQEVDRTTAWNISLPMTPPPAPGATPVYRLGSEVPDYWIPFVPIQQTSAGSSLQLQRARMPGASTGPLSVVLSQANVIYLEEVPREGILLQRRYRLARGLDGRPYLWIGRQRFVGKSEGRSGLRFDYLE